MNNQIARKEIQNLLDTIEILRNEKDENSNVCLQWKNKVKSLVAIIFPNSTKEIEEIDSIFAPSCFVLPDGRSISDEHQTFLSKLEQIKAKLESYEYILHLRDNELKSSLPNDSLSKVCHICSHFSSVVRTLRKRHSTRTPLSINDEYDVQYLLNALLAIDFEDIRPEEPMPSVAGTSARMDFLLKNEKIAIETKMTRKGLEDKELTKELIQDIAQYKSHPDVLSLVCFVYDLSKILVNPCGIKRDLEQQSTDKMTIKVIISPQG